MMTSDGSPFGRKQRAPRGFPDMGKKFPDGAVSIPCYRRINSLFGRAGKCLVSPCHCWGLRTHRRARRAKLPVFSRLAGNWYQRRVRSRLHPPGVSPVPTTGSGATFGIGCVAWRKHWVLRDRIAVAPADCTQGRLGQGRFRAGGLSSFRTYPARLSAGYRVFRSGENESSLGKRPRFPDGAGFSPNASDKRAPGSPPTGRRSLADLLRPIACRR
jgi:hypothetical protein